MTKEGEKVDNVVDFLEKLEGLRESAEEGSAPAALQRRRSAADVAQSGIYAARCSERADGMDEAQTCQKLLDWTKDNTKPKKKRICEIIWSEIVRSLLGFCYKKYPFLNVIIVTLMMCSNRGFIRSCICRGGSTPQKSKGQREPDGKTSAADPQICMLGIILQLKDISRD